MWRVLCAVLATVAFAEIAEPLVAGVFALIALCLALGWHDRVAALALALLWIAAGAAALQRGPMGIAVACALALHVVTPPSPYGSLAAVGRTDPGGSWIRPAWTHSVAWILLIAVDAYSIVSLYASDAITSAVWPEFAWMGSVLLILVLVPISLPPRFLRWVWCASIVFHVASSARIEHDAYSLASLALLHALAFDPGWIAPKSRDVTEIVFYDGNCGLCHRLVRFLLAEDRGARAFEFAPLHGPTFRERIPDDVRRALPDSLVVLTADGEVLARSRATLHSLARLGGLWRVLAVLASVVPPSILDRGYDGIARARHRLFQRPASACPLVPAHLMRRFQT
jgi:predicted DCC family thiol-disulfide oxidoreductase YuxK